MKNPLRHRLPHRWTDRTGVAVLFLIMLALQKPASPSDRDNARAGEYRFMRDTAARVDADSIRRHMQPLGTVCDSYPPAVLDYFRYYGLHYPRSNHWFGSLKTEGFTLAGHWWQQKDSARGTVFVLHGYYDHTGIQARLISWCLQGGYNVVAMDLPGHGLSTGEPASIQDFRQYSESIRDFAQLAKSRLDGPWHYVGHSAGCAAGLEYLNLDEDHDMKRIVFLAPLVKAAMTGPSKVAHFILGAFLQTTRRHRPQTSHDTEFMAFHRRDPLQYDRFPVQWATAMFSWQRRVRTYSPLPTRLLIVQGTRDRVVDWRHNLPFLGERFAVADTVLVEGARHHLANESPEYRERVRGAILEELQRSD